MADCVIIAVLFKQVEEADPSLIADVIAWPCVEGHEGPRFPRRAPRQLCLESNWRYSLPKFFSPLRSLFRKRQKVVTLVAGLLPKRLQESTSCLCLFRSILRVCALGEELSSPASDCVSAIPLPAVARQSDWRFLRVCV